MKINPPTEFSLTDDLLGRATRKMVRERAVELAEAQGRTAQEVSKSDWEAAKRELVGEREVTESAPASESEQWDPVPGSTGHKVHVPTGDEEDDEGRSDVERLVIEGVWKAGREQKIEAEREAEKEE
jgi:hypothetical protein